MNLNALNEIAQNKLTSVQTEPLPEKIEEK